MPFDYMNGYLLALADLQEIAEVAGKLDESLEEEGPIWQARYYALLLKTRISETLAREVGGDSGSKEGA